MYVDKYVHRKVLLVCPTLFSTATFRATPHVYKSEKKSCYALLPEAAAAAAFTFLHISTPF